MLVEGLVQLYGLSGGPWKPGKARGLRWSAPGGFDGESVTAARPRYKIVASALDRGAPFGGPQADAHGMCYNESMEEDWQEQAADTRRILTQEHRRIILLRTPEDVDLGRRLAKRGLLYFVQQAEGIWATALTPKGHALRAAMKPDAPYVRLRTSPEELTAVISGLLQSGLGTQKVDARFERMGLPGWMHPELRALAYNKRGRSGKRVKTQTTGRIRQAVAEFLGAQRALGAV